MKSLGIAGAVTSVPAAAIVSAQRSSEGSDDDNTSEESTPAQQEEPEPTEMTITWEPSDPGSEHVEHECEETEEACWHWVLTPGGHRLIDVGTLTVTFDDGTTVSDDGWRAGGGAHHFDICRETGGTIAGAEVEIVAEPRGRAPGEAEPFLTISGVECKPVDVEPAYWQIDFAEGDEPNIPPTYFPDDLMAGLGSTLQGVLANPDLRRQETDGQLRDVDILDDMFHFDDDDDPTEVTVEFTLDEGAPERDLHLALFELPGPYDPDEVEDQEYVRHDSDTFSGGDSGSLTISLDLS